MSDLYKTVMELCESKGVSGYRMCKDTGIQPSVLTDLKMGRQKSLNAKNANKIANYFGVSMDFLLEGEEQKKSAEQVSGLRGTGYENLTPENQKVIDALIETLLKSQSDA